MRGRRFFEGLVQKYGLMKVLDAGCGTGFHSILLAKLGLDVTGIDSSSEMLKKAKETTLEHNVNVRFHQSTLQDVSLCMDERFDAVFCMGNSLPHLLTEGEAVLSLKNFFNKFNILMVKENQKGFSHKLISTDLKPLYHDALIEWLNLVGFQNVKAWGSCGPFLPNVPYAGGKPRGSDSVGFSCCEVAHA